MNSDNFKDRVLAIVKMIPKGSFLTYRQVAEIINNPKAYRAVGNVLNKNHDPNIPCHRVIRSDGKVGGYNRGGQLKERLLRDEGVKM